MAATVHDVFKLDLHGDSCEFSLVEPDLFVVGCYQLVEGEGRRDGAVVLFRVHENKLEHLQSVPGPGVFDLKWFQSRLAIASAHGTVDFYSLQDRKVSSKLGSSVSEGDGIMSLAVGWNVSGDYVSSSYSSGCLKVFDSSRDDLPVIWENASAHSHEAWTCRFDAVNPNVVYSGADDCMLKAWDTRAPTSTWVNKTHMMGVTTLETNPNWPNLLLVGSYDEKVTAWDLRKPTRQSLAEIDVGGGVWRIRSRQSDDKLAVAAMRGFFHAIDFDPSSGALSSIAVHDQVHPSESLCYGCDWMPNSDVIAAASFYDNQLSIWSPNVGV